MWVGLRFIIGRAGTGKTHTCLREIQGELALDSLNGPPLILLVPEQASFQMEKQLTSRSETQGVVRAQVMSFRRLGWLVFQEAGGTNRQYLDELGKQMVLRSILMKEEKNLQIFHSLIREQGFIAKLAGSFKEFKSYNITPAQLEEEYRKLVDKEKDKEIIAKKVHDLALLFTAFQEFMKGHQTDPDDYLTLLAERIKNAFALKKAKIWIDSFAGFTPQELQVIGSLMAHSSQVNISLCLDKKDLERELTEIDLFHPSWLTYQQVKKQAKALGVTIEPPEILDGSAKAPRFINSHLAFIEKNFEKHVPLKEKPENIDLSKADNRRVEIEGIARKIQQLSREEGYRYRNMAVILRDFSNYQELIETIFREHKIPFFMDIKRTVAHHPLIELILAALETVNSYWNYEPLFRYLKTDLVRVRRHDIDYLENYVLKYGIHGGSWLKKEPWSYGFIEGDPSAEKAQGNLNDIRDKAVGALREFYQETRQKEQLTGEEATTRLYSFLIKLQANKSLQHWSQWEEDRGNLDQAKEHIQIWDGVMELFDQLVNAMGKEKMTLPEYTKIIEAGLHGLRLGLIPPALDQVLVGTVDRSRQPELKAVFLPGLNEGVFPARIKEDEIFSDNERENLKTENLELAPTSKMRVFHEQYLAYIAFTRASEYLWISYPGANDNGKELMPSYLIRKIQELMPGLNVKSLAGEPNKGDFPAVSYFTNLQKTTAYLAERLQEATENKPLEALWQNLCHWLINKEEFIPESISSFMALNHDNISISLEKGLIDSLYGAEQQSSVSRLEAFASCPFRYFARYGLGLKKREVFQADALLKGNFYHTALNEIVNKMKQRGRNWGQMEDEELIKLTKEVSAEILPTMGHGVFFQNSGYQYWTKVMEKNLEAAVSVLTTHAKEGKFLPVATELSFPLDDDSPYAEIQLSENKKLRLKGQIDRIDLAEIDGETYLRVIDYKSSPRGLDLGEIYHGLTLQLPVYLKVALEIYGERKAKGAGMFYFPIINPLISAKNPLTPDKAEEEKYKQMKMIGRILAKPEIAEAMGVKPGGSSLLIDARLTTKREFYKNAKVLEEKQLQDLQDFIWHKLAVLGGEINEGKTAISPYRLYGNTPCGYCDYKPSCQFDSLIAGNQYNNLPKLTEAELWASMGDALKGGREDE